MEELYSRVEEGLLLHIICRQEDMERSARQDFSPEKEYLQVTSLNIPYGKIFRPHRHLPQTRMTEITQESMIVVKGLLKSVFYDIDNKPIKESILNPGDCSITFRGGHSFESLQNGTLVYEHKTGPYNGLARDKEFI